jgi:hypothetical protein
VAPRGLSKGLSPLGDILMDGFQTFSEHVELDQPGGVEKIFQYTVATKKIDEFKNRYPKAKLAKIFLKSESLMAEDDAFLIGPTEYSNWLLSEALQMKKDLIQVESDLVVEVQSNEMQHVKTLQGKSFSFDKVVFAGGIHNRYWKQMAPKTALETAKAVQGCYWEFNKLNWKLPSFSLTIDGDNLIWNQRLSRLLIGSTSQETAHVLAPINQLKAIYERIDEFCDLDLPLMEAGIIKVGIREKARKREPYLIQEGHQFFIGGLYKNGFSLALKIARNFSHQHL